MKDAALDSSYPRPLTKREREWIEWILPSGSPGYEAYRKLIAHMVVLGEGRRGPGELILGPRGETPDLSAPLPAVFAYGVIETSFGPLSITMREVLDGQISVELVSHRAEEVPEQFEEGRRWTYSTWKTADACPQCRQPVREVPMYAPDGRHFVLAICRNDQRLWIFDAELAVNRLIPVTNFYNELMLHKNIRDPRTALNAKLLFSDLETYSDDDLTYAFLTYNKLRSKVQVQGPVIADKKEKPSLLDKLIRKFLK